MLKILIIDDDESERFMIGRALRRNNIKDADLRFVNSGHEAIAYFEGEGEFADRDKFPFPTIVLTDLKMTAGDGFEVLKYLKSKPQSQIIPVLVLSGSADADDVKRSYAMGASCYIQKRAEPAELERILKLFYDFWKECEVPEIDSEGQQVPTTSAGKLGERFGHID